MRSDGSVLLDRISKKALENLLTVGMTVVACLGMYFLAQSHPPKNSVDMFVALNPDGSSESQLHTSFVWLGPAPMRETTFCGSVQAVEDRWTDGAGRALEMKTEPHEKGGYVTHVRFPEPIFPDERVELKHTNRTVENVVQRDGEDYVYRTIPAWGGNPYALTFTVTLPKGAKVVSTQPEPAWRCESDGRPLLRFKWVEKQGHHPELRVKYSLPKALAFDGW